MESTTSKEVKQIAPDSFIVSAINVGSSVYSYIVGSNSVEPELGLKRLAGQQILQINNEINGLFAMRGQNDKTIETPCLAVVGVQSSGKSSLLNSIIGMDILPMGSKMVTRTPLQLNLIHSATENQAVFGHYKDGVWMTDLLVTLSTPPTKQENTKIREEIDKQTLAKAGKGCGISSDPIIIKILSPHVPNLSLIDLPGITQVAMTDQGQPKDIAQQIKNLIGSYIKSDRTIILAVMAGRSDLEADNALGFIKEYDPSLQRTVGVITKIDCMNKDSSVADYLSGSISKDLQMRYGYFAVRNRTTSEMESMTLYDGLLLEKKWFKGHEIYGKIKEQHRLGVPYLIHSLSSILVDHIRKYLPIVSQEISKMQNEIDQQLLQMGPSLPADSSSRMSLVNSVLANLCKRFNSALEEKGNQMNTGRVLKEIFVKYREAIWKIDPFVVSVYPDEYIMNAIRNCEGNHMSFSIHSVEVMEHCLRDSKKKPISLLMQPSLQCLKDTSLQLTNLIHTLLNLDEVARFPKLVSKIDEEIRQVFIRCEEICGTRINDMIRMEENYIWTDDPVFVKEYREIMTKTNGIADPNSVRVLLSKYFNTIKITLQNTVPKIIMSFLVRSIEDTIYATLFDKISKPNVLDELLQESHEQVDKRRLFEMQKSKVVAARKMIDQLS